MKILIILLVLTGCYRYSEEDRELCRCKAERLCETVGGYLFIKYPTLWNLDGIVLTCKGRMSYTNIQRMEVNGCLDLTAYYD